MSNTTFNREDYSYLSWREALTTPFKPETEPIDHKGVKVTFLFLFYILFQFIPVILTLWLQLSEEMLILMTFGFIALSGTLTILIGRYGFKFSPLKLGREDYPGSLRAHWKQVAWTLATSYAALLLVQVLVVFTSTIVNDGIYEVPTNQQMISYSLEQYLEMAFLVSAVVAPLVEEYLFRGLIMRYLSPEKPWVGLLVSTVIFSLSHTPTTFWAFIQYSVLGIAFGWVYLKTRRFEYPVLLHFINNLIALAGLI